MMDADLASHLINEIGLICVHSEELPDDWDSLAVVTIMDGSTQVSGYSYDTVGEWTAFLPDEKIMASLKQFHSATRVPGESAWKTALFQVKRANMQVKVQFDYDDPLRWKVSPRNLESMIAAMRP